MFAALALLCLTSLRLRASPTISWSGIRDVSLGIGTGEYSRFFDLNDDGVDDFVLQHDNGTMSFAPESGNFAVMTSITIPAGTFERYRPMPEGTEVGETLASPYLWSGAEDHLVNYKWSDIADELVGVGPWVDVANGLLGISFDIDGATHYGWIRMSNSDPFNLVVNDWAWETEPGVGIALGAIPEPSSLAMFLAGCGTILGVRLFRKRSRG